MRGGDILQLIIEKESWEEIIYHLVSIEGLDPWDIDLVRLADSFITFIGQAEQLDFRIPAKVIFVAAILLRLKADRLAILETEEEVVEEETPPVELGVDVNQLELDRPLIRLPRRQVTLDELIWALRKALRVKERREARRRRWTARLRAEVELEADIARRIEGVMGEIERLMRRLGRPKVSFRQIVKRWNREQIVDHYVPLLHLEQDGKVRCEQEEFFAEIYISKPDKSTENRE